jgi:alpha-mannosidase
MADRSLHLICNAHLDPVWLWPWEEGAAEAVSTFRTAADLCEEFDGFIFNHNEAILYQWVEEYEPLLFARIQRLVAAGKWHIMGGWHLQPDCNMPSGESLVRQILTGRRYFADKFGVRPTTAINLDPFGHTRGMVQILARCGYDSYLFCRPNQNDCPLPEDRFIWVGYDGSEVMATRVAGYNSPLGQARGKVEGWLQAHPDLPVGAVLWGVGNHGGGPSRADLHDLAALIADTTAPQVRHSTPEAYFAELQARGGPLPRHTGDLNPWAIGCYTSQVRLKQKHRLLENELYATEKMASAAWAAGLMEYPAAELASAQRDLLTAQFHDILPGSSVQPVEETSLRLLEHGRELISRARARAFFALAAGQPPAPEGQIPVLVYNPHPYPVTALVECEFMLADQNWSDTFTVPRVRQGRREMPSQVEKEDSNLTLDWRKRVCFRAELKPSQMNRFDCQLETLPARPAPRPLPDGDQFTFTTDDLLVTINTRTGLLDRYCVQGVDYLAPGAGELLVLQDDEDPWGMRDRAFRKVVGRFQLLSPRAGTRFSGVTAGTLPSVRVVEEGAVRTVVEAVFGYRDSFVCQRYKLPRQGAEIEIETRVHWNEKDRLLKLAFPLPADSPRYVGQVAYGVADLPANGDEAVAQKWVAAVTPDGRTLTCINEGLYGSDLSPAGLRLTLLRSPAYSAHPIGDRPLVPQDRYTPRIDQGERLFRVWLNGGPERERLERVDREALAHNEAPLALSFFPPGQGEAPLPLVTLSDRVVQMTVLKRADEGEDLIVRLFEPTGRRRTTTVRFPALGLEHKAALGPFEIKTLRVSLQHKTVCETGLMEEE